MFSRVYPAYHEKKGQKTDFVEKIWAAFFDKRLGVKDVRMYNMMMRYLDNENNGVLWDLDKVINLVEGRTENPFYGEDVDFKCSTIRALRKRKDTGQYKPIQQNQIFEPRVWSGEPYKSKQVAFAPNLQVMFTHDFYVKEDMKFILNRKILDGFVLGRIAYNDGLTTEDFKGWFDKPMEKGQLLIFGLVE